MEGMPVTNPVIEVNCPICKGSGYKPTNTEGPETLRMTEELTGKPDCGTCKGGGRVYTWGLPFVDKL